MQQPPPQPPSGDGYHEPTQPLEQPPPYHQPVQPVGQSYSEPTQPVSQPPVGQPESGAVQPPTMPQGPGTPSAGPTQPPPQEAAPGRANWVTFSRLRGHPLIDIAQGKAVGKVDDVLFDQQRQAIQAFCTRGGLFHKSDLVPAASASIGADAVTFQPGALAGRDTAWLEELPRASQIVGKRVMSNTGQLLGTVEDLRIDPEGARLAALELVPEHTGIPHRLGGARRLLAATSVISYGPDTIMAREEGLSDI